MRGGLAGGVVAAALGLHAWPVQAAPMPPNPPAPGGSTRVAPVAIERIRYEDARRVLIIEGPRRPPLTTRLLGAPDRLEVDLPGCVLLRPDLQVIGSLGRTLRKVRVLPGAIPGGGVRLVLELVPGTVGSVALRHEPRRVILALGAPSAATGEAVLAARAETVASSSVATPPEGARPVWVEENEAASEAPRLDRMWHWPRILGAGSTVELRWHQLDDVEVDGTLSGPVFGTSTGLRDLRWRHWLWPNVGLGLRGTLVVHDQVYELRRMTRTDWALVPDLAVRAIAGPCEFEVRGGYVLRSSRTDGVVPEDLAASAPALTTAFLRGPSIGFTCRTRLTSALGFDAGIDWAPGLTDSARAAELPQYPLSRTDWFAAFVVDVEPLTFRIGWEEAISRGQPAATLYRQTLSGLHVGLGLRY